MYYMHKYRKSFKIPYYDSDKNGKATPLSILSYLGETSGAHTDSIGFSHDKISKLNYAWMLNRWKVRIEEYPNVKDKITIETWSSGIDRFYATREFIIYNEKEKEIGRASTLWIFIDIERKRPVRIPQEYVEMIKPVNEKLFHNFFDFKKEYSIDNYIDFHVRRSDIDYNNHVNNTKYLSWMLEAVPENIYENNVLNEFEILFKKETIYGHTILSGIKESKLGEERSLFLHSIINRDNKESQAMGLTIWRDKKS